MHSLAIQKILWSAKMRDNKQLSKPGLYINLSSSFILVINLAAEYIYNIEYSKHIVWPEENDTL